MSHISKNRISITGDHTAIAAFVNKAAQKNKTLRVAETKTGYVMYAKKQSVLGKVMAWANLFGTETQKRELVKLFLGVVAKNSNINDDAFVANLRTDKSPKARNVRAALPAVVEMGEAKYVIGPQLAKSSGARIYKAVTQDGRACAMKVFKREEMEDDLAFAKVQREIEMFKQAEGSGHPNIVPCLGSVEPDADTIYLAMPLMAGDGIRVVQRMSTAVNLSPADRKLMLLTMFKDGMQGLVHAHRNGVIHMDFKLDNIMFDNDGVGKLIDWGIARPNGDKLGGPSGIDEPLFKSPEAAMYDELVGMNGTGKGRTDWNSLWQPNEQLDSYSVGASLAFYLSERPAIPAPSNFKLEMSTAVANFETSKENTYTRQRAQTRGAQLAGYESVLDKTLISNPEERATVAELLELDVFKDPEIGSERIRKLIKEYCSKPEPTAAP